MVKRREISGFSLYHVSNKSYRPFLLLFALSFPSHFPLLEQLAGTGLLIIPDSKNDTRKGLIAKTIPQL